MINLYLKNIYIYFYLRFLDNRQIGSCTKEKKTNNINNKSNSNNNLNHKTIEQQI